MVINTPTDAHLERTVQQSSTQKQRESSELNMPTKFKPSL